MHIHAIVVPLSLCCALLVEKRKRDSPSHDRLLVRSQSLLSSEEAGVRSQEAFYIRDGRITYTEDMMAQKTPATAAGAAGAALSFLQVFPDNGECRWSATIELASPAAASATAGPAKGQGTGYSKSGSRVAVALRQV
jgi:hypothetical protein